MSDFKTMVAVLKAELAAEDIVEIDREIDEMLSDEFAIADDCGDLWAVATGALAPSYTQSKEREISQDDITTAM